MMYDLNQSTHILYDCNHFFEQIARMEEILPNQTLKKFTPPMNNQPEKTSVNQIYPQPVPFKNNLDLSLLKSYNEHIVNIISFFISYTNIVPNSMSTSEYYIKHILNTYYQINNQPELVIPLQRPQHYNIVSLKDKLDLSLLKLYNNTMADSVSILITYENSIPQLMRSNTTSESLIKNIIELYQEINRYLHYMEKIIIL